MSTATDHAATIRAVLGDDLMAAMIRLRRATHRYVWWPWSRTRRRALFTALEDVMALQVNRVVGTASYTVTILEEPIKDHETRIAALEAREDGRQP